MSEPIKVLHVVGQMNRGGTETLLMSLLKATDRSQFQYDFVEQTPLPCDYDDELLSYGSIIYRCPTISPTNLRRYRLWWRRFFEEHPEYWIVHGHSRGSAPLYLDEANRAGRVTILHCHNNSFGLGIKGLIRKVWQTPLKTIADYNFACSYESGVSQFGKNGVFRVIKNGILTERFAWDPEKRKTVREAFGLKDRFVIGNVARFEAQKNHSFLIDIFHEVRKLCPEARLLLVGHGTYEEQIREKVKGLGLEDKVIFAGLRSDVNELLQAMDVFVLPSHFEGLGIVNIEAQAACLPCYVSARVVPPEAKVTELLHYVPLEAGAAEWARQIVAGYIPPEERRDTTAEIAAAGFDIHTTAEELAAFYRTAAKGRENK